MTASLTRSARAAAFAALALLAAACDRGAKSGPKIPPPPPPTASPGAIVSGANGSVAPAGGSAAGTAATPASNTGAKPLSPVSDDPVIVAADRGRIQGDSTAPVWVVIISDFQCPFCKQWHDQTYAQLKHDYVDTRRVRLAYVNFPIRGHQNAWPAAISAMCASAQNRFWQMHDALFSTQEKWETQKTPQPMFDSLATAAGVPDMGAWRSCVQAEKPRPLIQADQDRAVRSGIRATPTFIIGQALVEGAVGFDEMKVRLDSALAVAGSKR